MTYIADDETITENDYVLGDVNGDGIVSSDDASLIQQYIMGEISFTGRQFKAADMNKDGEVRPSDYVILCNKIEEMYQKGDVNTDGIIDVKDFQLVKDYVAGKVEFNTAQRRLADMDNDGNVTLTDAGMINDLLEE